MDESKAILHLMVSFPYKSEDYLREKYRNCNRNMNATIEAINNDRPQRRNIFCGLFSDLIDGFAKLCSCGGFSSTDDDEQDPGPSTRGNSEIVNINIGDEFARNLCATFSDSSLVLPTGFQPVIEIPVALGKQLYAAYVESIFRQQEAHRQIVEDLIKEDEEFARRLQDEENKYQSAKAIPKVPVQVDSRIEQRVKSALEFPKVHGKADDFGFDLPSVKRSHSKEFDSADDLDSALATFDQPATFYREQAQQHFKQRKQCYRNAKQCLKAQNHKLANYYFQQAREQTTLIEEANNRAAAAFLAENSGNQRKNTIDLHHLYVREAIQALDNFLDDEILSLQDELLKTKSLIIITGRGKHSLHGVPKIKPAVIERLEDRKLKYSELNPGSFRVHIFKHSYLTNELT